MKSPLAPKGTRHQAVRKTRRSLARTRLTTILITLSALLLLLASSSLAAAHHTSWFAAFFDSAATISTDKADYAPGDPVTITGTGFQPLEPVTLLLHEDEPSMCPDRTYTSYANGDGNFTNAEFAPEEHDVGVHFTLTATGQWSGLTATTTFTDATPTRIRSNTMSPNSGACGSNITAQATLEKRVGTPPATSFVGFGSGATITFTLRNASNVVLATGTGVTNSLGTASAVLTVPTGATQLDAAYAGDSNFNPVNTTIPFTVTTVCDNVAPTVLATGTANPGAIAYASGSYTNKNYVTVSLSATDNPGGTGVQSITYSATGATTLAPFTFTGSSTSFDIFNEGTTTVTYTAKDNANNTSAPQTFVVSIDRTAPTVNCGSADGVWHAGNVTIPCTASDGSGSGLANAGDASFNLSTTVGAGDEDANAQTDSRQVCDAAGNCATAGPIAGNMIDKKAPSLTCDSPDGLWHAADVSLVCTATDGGSGLSGANSATLSTSVASGTETANASTGSHVFTDAVGNSATAGPIAGNMIDKKAPSVSCGSADGAWHATDASIPCTATDGGSGISAGDQAFSLVTSVPANTETANASTNSRTVTDGVGNSSMAGPISGNMVDKKAPSVSCGSADSLWHAANVSIPCTAADGGSGLSNAADGGFLLSTSIPAGTETANASTNSRAVADAVGNSATAGPIAGNMIDRKGPVITITTPAVGGTYVLNQAVASSYTATDGGSGLASSTPASGLNINTATVGPKTFNVTATDNVGNVSTGSANYAVGYAPASMICPLGPGRTILQPINADGTSVFKQGSTVPAKFRVYDANCNSIGTAGVVADFRLVQVITGTVMNSVNEAVVSTAADPLYRWSASDQQWIFNTNTKGLAANATYVFRITLNDGTNIDFRYGLK
jgi:hypothetical protein